MITNERELQAAQDWIAYWKSTRTAQSWIGNEQAAQHIVDLRRQIDDFRHRMAGENAPAAGDAAVQGEPRVSPA